MWKRGEINEEQREDNDNIAGIKKLKVKGRSAVDPDSGKDETGHILEEKNDIYSVMLNLTGLLSFSLSLLFLSDLKCLLLIFCLISLSDLSKGMNSYYELQLIEEDTKNVWYVFRKWGR
jgi:poly [ADP-ribose] polymerase